MKNKYEKINAINKWIVIPVFIPASLAVLYPLVYVVSAAFSPGNLIAQLSVIPFGNGFAAQHFAYLFARTNFPIWFRNASGIAACTSLVTVIVASLSAYVFSRFAFVFKKPMTMSLLVLQIFPSFVGMVAVCIILWRIGGLDTLWGLVLVYIAGNIPYNTWLVKSYIDTVPRSLDEAARIEGASHFRIYRTIILPVIKPIIVFLALTSFTGPWMDFIFPKMILRSAENQTLALGLLTFISDRESGFTTFAAGALIVAVPFMIFFTMSQKMIVTSFGQAAVKE